MKLHCHHLCQAAVQHQTVACCCPAVHSVITYLRYLCKLCICLAALVCCLHSNLIVIHKGPVHSELAGLRNKSTVQIRFILYQKIDFSSWSPQATLLCHSGMTLHYSDTERNSYNWMRFSICSRARTWVSVCTVRVFHLLPTENTEVALIQRPPMERFVLLYSLSCGEVRLLSGRDMTPGRLLTCALQDSRSIINNQRLPPFSSESLSLFRNH